MFIKRKEYEELKGMAYKLITCENTIVELREKLRKYESGRHECDELCVGCQHLVESKETMPHSSIYSIGGYRREYTTRRCALDRTCKDFKADEAKKSEGEKNE